jgi:hypothetical protein
MSWSTEMKLAATVVRSLQADIQTEPPGLERAVTAGTKAAGRGLKTELRRQVTSAGLGHRLANSWHDKYYPNQRLDAASLATPRRRRLSAPRVR